MSTKKLNIDILARDKSKQALSGVRKNLQNVKNSVFSLKGALVGLGAGAVIKGFVDVGKEVESLNIRFKFLFGSAEEGAKAFDNLSKFAGTVPFSLEEISRASGNLAVVSKDAEDLNRVLEITGNVAAVTGLDFETTSSQIQRAFAGGIGAADLFRERGVRALLGFQAGAKVTAEETVARFEELFSGNGRFASATKDLATTLEGTISMIGDKFFNFQKDVAEGFFEELKGEFGDLNEFLAANEKQIEDIATSIGQNFAGAIQKTSETIKGVAPSVKFVANALGTTIEGFKSLPTFVQSSGLIAALLFGKKGALAFAGVSFLVGQIQNLIESTRELATTESLLDALGEGEIDAFTLSLEEIDDLLKHIGNTDIHPTLDLGSREGALELFTILTKVRSQLINTNNTIEHSTKLGLEMSQAFNSISKEAKNSNEELKEMTKDMNRAVLHGTELGEEMQNALEGLGNNTQKEVQIALSSFEKFKKGFKDAMNENTFDGFQKAGEVAFTSLTKSLTDFVMTGKLDMKSFAEAVKRALVEALIGQAVQFALDKSLALFKMRAIKEALTSVYLGALATFKAIPFPFNIAAVGLAIKFGMGLVNKIKGFESGGRPPVNRPSIVGERGAELFVPDQAGTIVPNNQLGGSVTNVSFTINAVDTRGFRSLLRNERGTIVNLINEAVTDKGRPAVI
jgi:hypothetical protein